MTDELVLAKAMLSLVRQRIESVKARAPSNVPSEKQLYIMAFPELTGTGEETPEHTAQHIGSDAAFVVQKILLVAEGDATTRGYFSIVDKSSGGRELFSSQRNLNKNNRFPVTHFANTLPDSVRGATYSFFPLHSEYLLPKRSSVELVFAGETTASIRVALAGYKVYA